MALPSWMARRFGRRGRRIAIDRRGAEDFRRRPLDAWPRRSPARSGRRSIVPPELDGLGESRLGDRFRRQKPAPSPDRAAWSRRTRDTPCPCAARTASASSRCSPPSAPSAATGSAASGTVIGDDGGPRRLRPTTPTATYVQEPVRVAVDDGRRTRPTLPAMAAGARRREADRPGGAPRSGFAERAQSCPNDLGGSAASAHRAR